MNLKLPVPDNSSHHKSERSVNECKYQFQSDYVRKVFRKQKVVTGDVAVVVVGDAHIEQNIQQHRKVEKCKVEPVTFIAHSILNCSVDPKDPKRFDQQIQEKK